MKKAFSLVEILIVVAMLGILAAIIMPEFQGYTQKAKEAAAKDNLRILRNAIKVYTAQHNDTSPGYYNNGSITPTFLLYAQFTKYTNPDGLASATKSGNYTYGPYLQKIPENPFNGKATVLLLGDDASFPEFADGSPAWLYKPAVKEIRLNHPGTDSEDTRYYDY